MKTGEAIPIFSTKEKSGSNHTPSLAHQNIRVSQAVLDAAMKEGDPLFQSLQTGIGA